MKVDRGSPLPLYHQLKEILTEQIGSQALKPGEMLPTEEQLESTYGVSRITVRQALKELELEGLIVRFRGKGTFVAEPKLKHSPEPNYSLTDYLLEQGMQPGWEVLSAEWVGCPADVASRLKVKKGSEVYHLRRLRLANDQPIGLHNAFVPAKFANAIDEGALESGGSLRYLNQQGFLDDSTATRTVEAILATGEVAELLNVDTGSALMRIQRLALIADQQPVEDFTGIYRGDRFKYQIRPLPAINPASR